MIREAAAADLEPVVAIYNEAVASGFATADTSPVSVDSRRSWFEEHAAGGYPIYVWDEDGRVDGWCSLSPYRPGRQALRFTAEISFYVRGSRRRRGVATGLIRHAIDRCEALRFKTLFAIVLERNAASRGLLTKMGFSEWGFLPGVADFDGEECGHVYYGLRLPWAAGTRDAG